MTCVACSGIIEKETKLLKGVEEAQVNFATEMAEFKTGSDFDLETFHALLKKLGYRAINPNAKDAKVVDTVFNADFYKALTALVLASVTMFFAMIVPNNLIQAILTTILVFGYGRAYVNEYTYWFRCSEFLYLQLIFNSHVSACSSLL
jgi:Cu+-exporting ATPase